jgi:PAS domain S-box-containing protein
MMQSESTADLDLVIVIAEPGTLIRAVATIPPTPTLRLAAVFDDAFAASELDAASITDTLDMGHEVYAIRRLGAYLGQVGNLAHQDSGDRRHASGPHIALSWAKAPVLEQNAFLANVIESLTHPFYVIDADDYSVLLANSASRWDGRPTTCHALTHGRGSPCPEHEHPCPMRMVIEGRRSVTVEHVHRLGDGTTRTFEVHGYPIFNDQGQVRQMIEYSLDITERRDAERELTVSHRELELLSWVAAAAAADLDPRDLLEAACGRLTKVLGMERGLAATVDDDGMSATIVVDRSAADRPSALGLEIPLRGEVSYRQIVHQHHPLASHDAQNDPRLASLEPLLARDSVRSLLAVPVVVEESWAAILIATSRRVRVLDPRKIDVALNVAGLVASSFSRRRLDSDRRRLQAAIDQTSDLVVLTDTGGRMVYVNRAFEKVTGYAADEVIGRSSRMLKSEFHDQTFYENLWRTITSGQEWKGRFVNRRKDGTLSTEDSVITPVRDTSGAITHFLAVKRDMSREVELERQFLHAQKMENVGRLAGGIAHDFNNLLGAILGNAEVVIASLGPEHPLADVLGEIIDTADRASSLTRRLLRFARPQSESRHPTQINELIEGLQEILRRLLSDDLRVDLDLGQDLPEVEIDPSQIEQVVINLAINARDAMPDGGTLWITTQRAVITSADEAANLPPGTYVTVEVQDTGHGMTQEVRDRVFEPFFTTKTRDRGTGLGLASARTIISQHLGHIAIESAPGEGTTVSLWLPATSKRMGIPTRTASARPTVLLCEDEDDIRQMVADILVESGYEVIEAASGTEGLQRAVDHGSAIDLLITDIMMPRMTGDELAERLRATQPELAVLFITSLPNELRPELHGDTGRTLVLDKPFQLSELIGEITRLITTPCSSAPRPTE